ncbi:cellulose biosynthesis protein BcsQ [Undibacterium sp. RTI2.1]|uniref:cellulose biosynthesis protein BcsQ n=1 Tax=unclassified Undibacterium TaxID=2630295 RepID=UPI002AB4D044|nr:MULTISPECIES: cellulose biosynthesis protein BcsQ [unclassified Undibacterium]MDY7538499.1 cellulose biosynthesis protein BcsQ [Undibacterium sp. 5I1]MEB0031954.1 cellulose biosynthesis protein BcsQ [Undibacterium sp. RTI2.1]MEB0114876.1 cellulose biosynthesis protein BcsQ [Undibacterium sp. RTI2.2]MEB0231534.1 cellulose biosynthesis protein BcsQ [Undibacterium sp. 10I3]MEB0255835.1 cellulose biosynthesis protein BcsQ [Undibacterium sp. 5I1]
MRVIAVVSPKGGVGKTTVTANLAAEIVAFGGKVTILDLDPQNALRLHYGMQYDDANGVVRQSVLGQPWRDAMYSSPYGVDFLPYGIVSETDRSSLEHHVKIKSTWLSSQLKSLNLADDHIVLIDTPPGPTVYLQQVLHCANIALIVLKPDAASYSTIPSIESLLHYYCGDREDFFGACYIINQMDVTKQLHRDVYQMLRKNLGDDLVPISIHKDEAVSEALACQSPVAYYAKNCSATHDLHQIANWLQTHFNLVT